MKQKSFLVFFASVFLFALITPNVLAIPTSLSPTDRLQQAQEKRMEAKERVATKTAQLRQDHIEKLKQVFTNILTRYEKMLNRLERISEKISTRIDKLEANGVDTGSAKANLEACGAKKANALSVISDAKAKVAAIDPASSTVKDAVKTSVDAIHSGKIAIRQYHKCLVDVTKTLKAKRGEATTSAD